MKRESAQNFIKRKAAKFKEAKEISMKDIGRKRRNYFTREAWTFMPEHKEKVFVVEKLKNKSTNKVCYRLGYYIIGKIGWAKDKWVWGQFCPMFPQGNLEKLLKKAKKEKTII